MTRPGWRRRCRRSGWSCAESARGTPCAPTRSPCTSARSRSPTGALLADGGRGTMFDGLAVTVVGPSGAILDRLRKEWLGWLAAHRGAGARRETATAAAAGGRPGRSRGRRWERAQPVEHRAARRARRSERPADRRRARRPGARGDGRGGRPRCGRTTTRLDPQDARTTAASGTCRRSSSPRSRRTPTSSRPTAATGTPTTRRSCSWSRPPVRPAAGSSSR